MIFKPMLAPGEDPLSYPDYFDKLQYPLLGSPKFDGIRCIIKSNKGNKLTAYFFFVQLLCCINSFLFYQKAVLIFYKAWY